MLRAVTWTTLALAALAVAGVLLAVMWFGRWRRSRSRDGRRQRLLHQFDGSRLRRMLKLRHLDPKLYLDATSNSSLDLHLSICRDCPRKKVCEAALQEGRGDSFWYCPNATMIERLLRDERRA